MSWKRKCWKVILGAEIHSSNESDRRKKTQIEDTLKERNKSEIKQVIAKLKMKIKTN